MKINIRNVALLFSSLMGQALFAQVVDTMQVVNLDEVEIVCTPKESGAMRQQPAAITELRSDELKSNRVSSLKGISSVVPNLFIPDYGSRLTSAVYIRGVGSRINTPAVGMYVDNIPYVDKSAFDFNFQDIERVDVMRGPQGTLYGRNAMGGVIRVYTRSPFAYQGTDIRYGGATKNNQQYASVNHYQKVSDHFAFSLGGYYEGSDGFFKHSISGKPVDDAQVGNGKFRAVYLPTANLKLDFTLGYDYSDEGAYPYYYTGSLTDIEPYPELVGKISANRESSYRRGMLNSGLNVLYNANRFVLNAVTGFQYLNDRMFLDQDFVAADIYTLEQKQRIQTFSEEVTFKSKGDSWWQWVSGVNFMRQGLHTVAPVTFYQEGVDWLSQTINGYMPDLSASGMSMNVQLDDSQLNMGGTFRTPTLNAAFFHQSTFRLTPHFSLAAGIRVDYDYQSMRYDAPSVIHYDFSMQSPRMPLSLPDMTSSTSLRGNVHNDYTQLLPRFSAMYHFDTDNMVYATVSKGMRSGGYNVQMISDLLQAGMRNQMMTGIKDGTNAYLDELAQRGMPQKVIDMIRPYLDKMPIGESPDVQQAIAYKPEETWNLEIGTHFSTANRRLQADIALFNLRTQNQQIARFAPSGLGRMMVNAGKSNSRGAEMSLQWFPSAAWHLAGSYGYTYAKFTDYDDGSGVNYDGHLVPFVPRHTFSANVGYKCLLHSTKVQSLIFGANYKGAGRIYFTESNAVSQPYYSLLGASVTAQLRNLQFTLWGSNLTNAHYNTFYFESAGRGFEQHGKPLQIGFDIKWHI